MSLPLRHDEPAFAERPAGSPTSDGQQAEVGADRTNSLAELLQVNTGEQAGACIDVTDKLQFFVGSGYENDVVLRSAQPRAVKLQIATLRGERTIELLDGSATLDGIDIIAGKVQSLPYHSTVDIGDAAFSMTGPSTNEMPAVVPVASSSSLFKHPVSLAAVVSGIALLVLLGLNDHWDAHQPALQSAPTLQQQLSEMGLADLQVLSSDSGNDLADTPEANRTAATMLVQGRVDTSESFRRLQQLVSKHAHPVILDVQNDAVLADAVEDIYRNHGITADVIVLGVGHVRVDTQGVDDATLGDIEAALQADLPKLVKLDSSNTPPVPKPATDTTTDFDPGKEVEAVIAGDISYVITRDQARYFVGAVLPSGHTITSISEGSVLMSREGNETRLEF